MFRTTGPHFCPVCPMTLRTHRRTGKEFIVGSQLELSEADYSGCGVDMANCPQCHRGFSISYKVDKIERAKEWDGEDVESGISVTGT